MTSDDAAAAFGAADEPRRRSALGYWLAGLIGVAAVGGAIVWFVGGLTGVGDRVDALQRVPIPGSGVLTLSAGKNAIYYEGNGSLRSLAIQLRAVDGPAVAVSGNSADTRYDIGGHSGRSVAGFKLERAGRYRLDVDGEVGGELAVGRGIGGGIVSTVLGGLGIFFGGLLLCGLTIILTARRRA